MLLCRIMKLMLKLFSFSDQYVVLCTFQKLILNFKLIQYMIDYFMWYVFEPIRKYNGIFNNSGKIKKV